MTEISIVVPVYGSPKSLPELCRRIDAALRPRLGDAYELILVNDGCPYGSWQKIEEVSAEYPNVIGIKLSRNFGQHFAMSAGVDVSSGENVVFMDCDLQDRPEEILNLYDARKKENVEVVFSTSEVRGEPSFFRQLTSRLYYRVYDYLSYNSQRSFNTSFMLMSRRVADAFKSMRESQRQFFSLINYLGFSSTTIEVKHDERFEGTSSYTFWSRLRMALKGLTTNSTRLLKVGISLGAVVSGSAFLYAMALFIKKLMYPESIVDGFTTIMVTMFFMSGLIILLLGVLGSYLETIFWEVKQRPYYFIEKQIGKHS